ncbi:MAG TPA: hypothetical protein VMN58_03335 [Acidimicrobiales bacterium]|nr:hypothetical protein [Acidimicrobiales bacterium]
MKFNKVLAAGAALATAASMLAFAPGAQAQTTATLSITGGLLTISEPASTVHLGNVESGSLTFSGTLGNVQVTDERGNLVATWTATVSATNFTTGTAATPAASETIANTNITYTAPAATTTGTGTFTPGVGLTLGAPATAGTWAGEGTNTATWNPTLAFTLLSSQVSGTYTGTVTHSVA